MIATMRVATTAMMVMIVMVMVVVIVTAMTMTLVMKMHAHSLADYTQDNFTNKYWPIDLLIRTQDKYTTAVRFPAQY